MSDGCLYPTRKGWAHRASEGGLLYLARDSTACCLGAMPGRRSGGGTRHVEGWRPNCSRIPERALWHCERGCHRGNWTADRADLQDFLAALRDAKAMVKRLA